MEQKTHEDTPTVVSATQTNLLSATDAAALAKRDKQIAENPNFVRRIETGQGYVIGGFPSTLRRK